jgi:SAM-dependent methyltransferase
LLTSPTFDAQGTNVNKKLKNLHTDWDEYYARPFPLSSATRIISARKIINLLKYHSKKNMESIAEIGGGNSYFINSLLKQIDVQQYLVLDTCQTALDKFNKRFSMDPRISSKKVDALRISCSQSFDLVFSIGLVEHFNIKDTSRAIKSHFSLCKPGGLVLISFPTPTLLYNIIRAIAELIGIWKFHDERPLYFKEVADTAVKFGVIKHQSILWKIGLTQGYLLIQKNY